MSFSGFHLLSDFIQFPQAAVHSKESTIGNIEMENVSEELNGILTSEDIEK